MSSSSRTAASSRAALGSPSYPDSIFTNGKIITADPDFSVVNAVAIRDGRFVAVGTAEEVGPLAGPSTVIVDLKGGTVLPGLIDTHAHVERAGLIKYTVQLNDVTSVAQALARISEHAAETPRGRWIRGAQWHPVSQLTEKRFLTRQELDQAAPDHPVCLPIGHFTLVNSKALELAGITRDTPDPDGGIIHRPGPQLAAGLVGRRACRPNEIRDAVFQRIWPDLGDQCGGRSPDASRTPADTSTRRRIVAHQRNVCADRRT